MSESVVVYDAQSNSYIEVKGVIYVPGESKLNIAECRKYYPGYVNGVLQDGLGNTHKTPDGFTNNKDGTPLAFFHGRVLVAIGHVPASE